MTRQDGQRELDDQNGSPLELGTEDSSPAGATGES